MNDDRRDEERRKARDSLGIPHRIVGRGARGWAKALAILIPAAMLGLWLWLR